MAAYFKVMADWVCGRPIDHLTDDMYDDYTDLFLRRLLVDTFSRILDQPPRHRDQFHAPYFPEMINISPWFIDNEYGKLRLPEETLRSMLLAESKQDYETCVALVSLESNSCTPISFLWRISIICFFSSINPQPSLSTLHSFNAFNAVIDRMHDLPRPIAFAAASVALAASLHLCVSRGLFRAQHGIPWLTQSLIKVISLHSGFDRNSSEDSALLCLYSNFACAVAASGRNDLARVVVKATEKRTRLLCDQRGVACPAGLLRLRGVLLHNQATLLISSGQWTRAYASVAELQVLLGLQPASGFDARLYEIVELAIDNLDAEFRDIDEDGLLMVTDCGSTDDSSSF